MTTIPVWIPEAIRYGQDPLSGAEVEQLTSQPVTSTNIYCEQRYASADGTRIGLSRKPFGQPDEIWVCDLTSLRVCRVAQGVVVAANAARNAIYYTTAPEPAVRLMRLDLVSLATREMFRFVDTPAPASGTISADECWFVGGPVPVRDNIFSLFRLDLTTGASRTLCEVDDMFNPHAQFEPVAGRQIMIQINRGGRRNLSGGNVRLTGPSGATLYSVNTETGAVQPLPAGRPHTPPISGHECWVGGSGRVIFTAGQYHVTSSAYVTLESAPDAERGMPAAAIYSTAPGETAARVVAQDLLFNHLAASDDGHFFIADDHATGRIYVGSIATGRSRPLCETHTRQGTCQYSHAHAYMTPDNGYVIFNSVVTGVAQVYAARIPPRFLEQVLEA